MSGAVKSNVFGSSGTVAAAAGGLKWEAVVTASTVTVESNRGYFVNTTSNACTVTLPASPDVGDQVILLDYLRTWDTNAVTIDSNGNDFQNQADNYIVDYDTEGQGINIVFSGSTNGWIPNSDIANSLTPVAPTTQLGVIAFGDSGSVTNLKNLVNSSAVVQADVTGVGTARVLLAASNFGGDKAVFGFGNDGSSSNLSNLCSNTGVISTDETGVGTARQYLGAAPYGVGLAIFAYGQASGVVNTKNLVNSSGVIASDASGTGTARGACAAAGIGGDKAVFGFGYNGTSVINLISNTGVQASDSGGTGTSRSRLGCATYDNDKAIFVFGVNSSDANVAMSNLVSNTGVVASDVSAVGSVRRDVYGTNIGSQAIMGYGVDNSGVTGVTNIISTTGVVQSDVAVVGTARQAPAMSGYGY